MRAIATALAAVAARAAEVTVSFENSEDLSIVALGDVADTVKIEWSVERSVVQFWDKAAYDARVPRRPPTSRGLSRGRGGVATYLGDRRTRDARFATTARLAGATSP